jgi:hypothetical protein
MKKKTGVSSVIGDIRRNTAIRYYAEEEIRMFLEGLKGETGITELCRRDNFYHYN